MERKSFENITGTLKSGINYVIKIENGKTIIYFTDKLGKKLPHIEYKSPLNNKKVAYRMIQHDIETCKEFILKLKELNNQKEFDIINQALWYSFIVIYGKCFTDSKKGRKISLEGNKKGALKYSSVEGIETHKKLMLIRHNYLAHSGDNKLEQVCQFIVLNSNFEDKKILDNMYTSSKAITWPKNNLNPYLNLITSLLKYLNEKSIILEKKLKEEISAIKIDDLYSKIIPSD